MDLWHYLLGIGGFVGWLGWPLGLWGLHVARRFGRAETARADDAEAERDLDADLMSATFGQIHTSIFQICKFCPDPDGPLVGPSGQRYDLRIVAATPGMRAFFYVPDTEPVNGRSHYDVYEGIYDKATRTVYRADWVEVHAATMMGEARQSGPDGDSFDGPDGTRTFLWATSPLLPDQGPEPGMAAGLFMEMQDQTELEVERQKRMEAEAKNARLHGLVDEGFDRFLGRIADGAPSGAPNGAPDGATDRTPTLDAA